MPFLPLLLVGGVATWYLLRMRSLGTNINFILRNIRVKGGSILQPNIELTIGAQNPTNQAATLKSLVGTIEYQGQTIASFNSFDQVVIQGNTETIIKINAIPNVLSVLNVIKQIIINRQPGKVISITGKANVNNIVVPLNSSFQF